MKRDSHRKKPLYRKVNTRARGVHHKFGVDYRTSRRSDKPSPTSMKKGVKRGLDYTPLYKFLLSKVGEEWDKVYSEALSRLDKEEPIWHMVRKDKDDVPRWGHRDYFMCGESSLFSALYIDDGILRVVAPDVGPQSLEPFCPCCTYTFNGQVFWKKYGNAT